MQTRNYFFVVIFFFIIITAFAGYVCFYQLGKSPLENWDEAWYADMIRNMIKSHEFILTYWNKIILYDKPPLQMWLSLPFAGIFGLNEFSIRIVSAISGFLTILFISAYSYRKWGVIPAFFAFITISMNNTFIWRVRSGNIDSLAAFLILLTYLFTVSRYKYKYIVIGIIFGLIYLTKASLVIFPLSIFLLHEICFERSNLKKNLFQYLAGALFAISISCIWLFFGYLKVGKSFIDYYLFQSDQGVSQVALKHLKIDYIMHLYYALQRRFTFLFLIGLIFVLKTIREKASFLLFCFSLFLILFLSITQRNNNWYLLPSMPFWSLVIAFGINKIMNLFKKGSKVLILFMGLMTIVSLYISYKTFSVNIQSIINTTGPVDQKNSGIKISIISKPSDVIIRTDETYPATVYYSDRKVLTYNPEYNSVHATFIGTSELIKCLNNNTCPILNGPVNRTKSLILSLGTTYSWEQVFKSGDEVVMLLK